jgi:hypothetical protein
MPVRGRPSRASTTLGRARLAAPRSGQCVVHADGTLTLSGPSTRLHWRAISTAQWTNCSMRTAATPPPRAPTTARRGSLVTELLPEPVRHRDRGATHVARGYRTTRIPAFRGHNGVPRSYGRVGGADTA